MTKPRATVPTGLLALAVPLAFALLGVSLWLGAAPASAHATLERTEPAANVQLDTEPSRVVLFFDQPVTLALGNVTVVGPGGAHINADPAAGDSGRTVTVGLRAGAGDGAYIVSYRVISLDAHPVTGGFFFQVGRGTGSVTVPGQSADPAAVSASTPGSAPEDATVRAVYAACRYAGFVGLLLLVGGAVFLVALWPAGVPDRRLLPQVWFGYGLVTLATMGELVMQAPYAAGTPLTGMTTTGFDAVLDTTFATAHLVRLALLALAAPVLLAIGARPRARWAIGAALPLGVGLVVTWAYSGHAVATVPAVSLPSDAVHLAAISVWTGGLVVLVTALLPVADAAELRAVLPRWSVLATVCVLALIISGSVQAVLEVGRWSALADTSYGRLLLVKIALLAVVLAFANSSRRWVRRWCAGRQLDPSRSDVSRLRQGVVAESLLVVAAVAVAAMLIEAAPGRTARAAVPSSVTTAARPITRHGPYRATVRRGEVVIHLKVDPAVVGTQYIYLDATRPDGHRIDVRQWTLTVSNDELGLNHVDVPVLIDSGVGHYYAYGSFTMTTGGTWTVQVTARTSDVDETIVTQTVRLRS